MSHRLTPCLTILLLTCLATPAPADDDAPPAPQRPKLNPNQRWAEDWSVLGATDGIVDGDLFDPIKHIALSDDGSIYLSLGGQARVRFEGWSNFGFSEPNDDVFGLWRVRVHGDLHVGPHLRLFVEGKSALLAFDRDGLPGGRRTLDVDTLDLQQAFIDVNIPLGDAGELTIRPGRQELLLGKQRLVSPLDWSNTRALWDGVSAIWRTQELSVTGFYTLFAPVKKYEFNEPDEDMMFYGLYATGRCPVAPVSMDLYWLGLQNDTATFNGTTGAECRHTLGGRLFGNIGDTGFDFDLEGAYQLGELGGSDIDAFMVTGELGFTLADVPTAPRLFAGAGYASGDNTAGGDVETFNQLYPLGHAYLGYIDAVGRQNTIDLTGGVTLAAVKSVNVKLQGHLFWLADTSDALYNAGGGVSRTGATSPFVGGEIDLTVTYQFDAHLNVLAGYSHFFAGDAVRQTGASDDVDFLYLQLQYTF